MKCTHRRYYGIYPLGLAVHRSINKEYTYRVRPGNGYYGAILGEVYQDRYTYFVPTSITDAAGDAARAAYAQAVANWQGFSDAQKKVYNNYVKEQNLRMSGYNYYLGLYIKANA